MGWVCGDTMRARTRCLARRLGRPPRRPTCTSLLSSATTPASSATSLTRTRFTTRAARSAKPRLDRVSEADQAAGEMVTITPVRLLPPKEACSRRVSLLSRYGMCWCASAACCCCCARYCACACALAPTPKKAPGPAPAPASGGSGGGCSPAAAAPSASASLEMTMPSVSRLWLMRPVSLSARPSACDFATRSLPARSTSVSTPQRTTALPPAWERRERAAAAAAAEEESRSRSRSCAGDAPRARCADEAVDATEDGGSGVRAARAAGVGAKKGASPYAPAPAPAPSAPPSPGEGGAARLDSTMRRKSACERLERAFIEVAATWRFASPMASSSKQRCAL